MSEGNTKMSKPIVPIKHELKTFEEIRDAMLMACKIMDTFGAVQGFGHISSRLPNTSNILVTARRPLGLLKAEDLVIIDTEGKTVEGNAIPFGERDMHLRIYQKRSDVGAICRFHSEMTSSFGVANRSVRPVHALGYLLGPEVKVLSTPDLCFRPERADKIGELLENSYGIIFRGNGAATLGTNIIDACVRALLLEESARIQYKASLIGKPTYLTMDEINRRNEDYYKVTDYDVYWRFWEYYRSKVS